MASLLQKGESALREIINPKSKDNLKSGATSPGTRSPPPEEAGARKSSELQTGTSSPTNSSTRRGFFGFGKKKDKERERDSRSVSSTAGTISPPESPPKSLATSPNIKPVTAAITSDAQVPATSISNEPPAKNVTPPPPIITTTTSSIKPISPPLSHPSSPTSPIRSISPPSPPLHSRVMAPIPSSPPHLSSSRISSSGSTQIFERNVQEGHPISVSAASPSSATGSSKIPAHIATEDHIPAVLEASSIAITDKHIHPDNVEVVMHAQHQPLATQNALLHHSPNANTHREADHLELGHGHHSSTSSQHSSLNTSNFTTDKRRLSFISFSDIVQAEQADLLDNTILSPAPAPTSSSSAAATTVIDQVGISGITETLVRRSPSPIRGFGTSPPRSSGGLFPERDNEGLVVETMGQALRKTGSGDLGKGGKGGL